MSEVIVQAVRIAAASGETIQVTSNTGSTPGVPVTLTVLSVGPGGYSFVVRKAASGDERKYDVNSVIEIVDSKGTRHVSDGTRYLSPQARERRAVRDDLIRHLSGHESIRRSTANRLQMGGSATARLGDRRLVLTRIRHGDNEAVIHAKDHQSVLRVLEALSHDEVLTFWDVCGVLVKAEFWWPAWARMQADVVKAAKIARRGRETLTEAPGEDWAQRMQLYAASGLALSDFGINEGGIHFLEADCFPLNPMFALAANVDAGVLRTYLASAWPSQRRFLEHPNHTPIEHASLLAAGLIQLERPPSTDEIIRSVALADFRALVKAEDIRLKARSREPFIDYFLSNRTSVQEAKLREVSRLDRGFEFVLPQDMPWVQFQGFRKNYETMYQSLLGWLWGQRPARATPYFDALV